MLMPISDRQVDLLLEQRLAELTDAEFTAMCERTRPPAVPASDDRGGH